MIKMLELKNKIWKEINKITIDPFTEYDFLVEIKRVLDKRTKTDQDVYELCRRVVQEKIDWEKAHYEDIIKNQLQHYLYIDNTAEADFQKNADKIFEYIKEQFHKA